jgi:hypothetical protein
VTTLGKRGGRTKRLGVENEEARIAADRAGLKVGTEMRSQLTTRIAQQCYRQQCWHPLRSARKTAGLPLKPGREDSTNNDSRLC